MRLLALLTILTTAAWAQVPLHRPAGLVLGNGASIQRGNGPAVRVVAGELVFSGDLIRAAGQPVDLLACGTQERIRLAPGATLQAGESGWTAQAAAGILERTPVASCYLPPSPKVSLASQQHYGVLAARSGSIPPPTDTLEQRIHAVPEPRRSELKSALQKLDVALRDDPRDAGALISRAAVLEQSGLLFDAGESYRTAAGILPGTPWLRKKVIDIENRLLANRTR
jgi:hypothetical protein